MKELLQDKTILNDSQINSAIVLPSSAPSYSKLPWMNNGHVMWEIRHVGDIIDIDAAELTDAKTHFNDKHFKAHKLITKKPGCYYIAALNEDNALKRYCNMMGLPFTK